MQQKLYNVGCSKADAVSMRGLSMQWLSDQVVTEDITSLRVSELCIWQADQVRPN